MCTVPGSEGKKLADMFRSNNPQTIADGLRMITERTAETVDEKTQRELAGEVYPDKMKDLNQLFGMANKLHNVVKPKAAPSINIGFAVGSGGVRTAIQQGAEPRYIAAEVMKELESEYPDQDITDEMIEQRILERESEVLEGEIVNE